MTYALIVATGTFILQDFAPIYKAACLVAFVIFEKAISQEPYGWIVKLYHRNNNARASCHLDELQSLQFNVCVTTPPQWSVLVMKRKLIAYVISAEVVHSDRLLNQRLKLPEYS